MSKQRKLSDVIKKGDKLLFTTTKDNSYRNVYLVSEVKVNDKLRDYKEQTRVRCLSSLNPTQVGLEYVVDYTHYTEVANGVFRSHKETRDKKGNVNWRSSGQIEILGEDA